MWSLCRSGQARRRETHLPQPGFEPRIFQPVAIRHTDYAILAPKLFVGASVKVQPPLQSELREIVWCFFVFKCYLMMLSIAKVRKSSPFTGLERPLGLQEVEAHEVCKVVSPKHRPPLPPRRYAWYSFRLKA